MKNFLRILIVVVSALLLIGLVACAIMMTTSYKPESIEQAKYTVVEGNTISYGDYLDIITWNIAHAGLDNEKAHFTDKGKGVEAIESEEIRQNLMGINETLNYYNADVYMIQDVDTKSTRTIAINEAENIKNQLGLNYAFAYDQKSPFVPYPWPIQGRIESGNATFSPFIIGSAHRVSLPQTQTLFPLKYSEPKRSMLIVRNPITDSSKNVVFINVNLDRSKNDDQIKALSETAKAEYEKGNYVIIGGTFNKSFNGAQKNINDKSLWDPQILTDYFSNDWEYIYDDTTPSVRTLNTPYLNNMDKVNTYTVDGFICSPNVKIQMYETVNEEFFYSSHNPVHLVVKIER